MSDDGGVVNDDGELHGHNGEDFAILIICGSVLLSVFHLVLKSWMPAPVKVHPGRRGITWLLLQNLHDVELVHRKPDDQLNLLEYLLTRQTVVGFMLGFVACLRGWEINPWAVYGRFCSCMTLERWQRLAPHSRSTCVSLYVQVCAAALISVPMTVLFPSDVIVATVAVVVLKSVVSMGPTSHMSASATTQRFESEPNAPVPACPRPPADATRGQMASFYLGHPAYVFVEVVGLASLVSQYVANLQPAINLALKGLIGGWVVELATLTATHTIFVSCCKDAYKLRFPRDQHYDFDADRDCFGYPLNPNPCLRYSQVGPLIALVSNAGRNEFEYEDSDDPDHLIGFRDEETSEKNQPSDRNEPLDDPEQDYRAPLLPAEE